ncbi:endonuclease/exonuclease/phosphatase family protein [Rhodocytophaga rosea]|uniref:Endonuclease/exonuclease/phosphatase family protein n=1 Tax=Rhodocytophaga rosea TaxID=2704465 RepID=A0A6C0GQA1_9BACT|nr:endonuclease/exonuclease/phosphatase family protein [Rhodocytophaga rosea]QHT69690.1 endonuclease/exonuclease/phosphatase family protein [Rhodocytophaga rosea]
MKLALEIAGCLMIAFTFLPMIRTTKWWIRILDFPRFQIAIIITAILLLYLITYRLESSLEYVFVVALIGCWILQARYIYPFTFLSPKPAKRCTEPDPENTIRLMISNIKMSNKNTGKFLEIVKQNKPDMLLVNEPNNWWAEHLSELDKDYPYSVKKPLENTYGMMLFSKLEFIKANVQFLLESDIPSIHTILKLRSGEEIEFCGVHPQPPTIGSDTDKREAELLVVGKSVKESKRASIVAGDLNDVGWSHTTKLFERISGLLDPRIGRGFFNTYNVFVPFFRYPLDHVFYDPRFKLSKLERLPKFGSDHFPILIELVYKPEEKHEQQPKKADHEDKKEAAELIEKGMES